MGNALLLVALHIDCQGKQWASKHEERLLNKGDHKPIPPYAFFFVGFSQLIQCILLFILITPLKISYQFHESFTKPLKKLENTHKICRNGVYTDYINTSILGTTRGIFFSILREALLKFLFDWLKNFFFHVSFWNRKTNIFLVEAHYFNIQNGSHHPNLCNRTFIS